MMGNEAIAWGAALAGVDVATGYPGTPSSEVLETLAGLSREYGFYAEWSVNEKVALEVAAAAAYTGARAIVTMKQVGLNVAADPLMTLAYIGVKGGLVIVSADDPGPHSSQNEQDTRAFARMAKLPVLEPSDPGEALELTRRAFELSEQWKVPVVLRPTTRVCHGTGPVDLDRAEVHRRYQTRRTAHFERSPEWVIFPALARRKHEHLVGLQDTMRGAFGQEPYVRQTGSGHRQSATLGIACSGVSRTYVKEAVERAGLAGIPVFECAAFPVDHESTAAFLGECQTVLVVEEGDPILETELSGIAAEKGLDTRISGRNDARIPWAGELDVDRVLAALGAGNSGPESQPAAALPVRPPVLCAGCPHRASFYLWKQAARSRDAVFTGDIGCYTLGNAQPLDALDTCLCMGASFTMAQGLWHADPGRPHVAFLGDSTFFHTGIPGMINAVYNGARVVMVILDNSTTAMTGNQPHPGVGRTVTGKPAPHIDPAEVARACGVPLVREADPFDMKSALQVAHEALAFDGPSVVVMRQPCVTLVKKSTSRLAFAVDQAQCKGCDICVTRFGCPAMAKDTGKPVITAACSGCGVCAQICPAGAIREVGR